jgi:hypothetical protein
MVARVGDGEQFEKGVDCSIVAEKVERTGKAKFLLLLLLLTKVQPEEDLQIEDWDAADDDDDDDDGAFLLTCL